MRRILVADSDPHVLFLCRDELQEEGYEVLVASNAKEALGLLDENCPDLVVLEILLPDMSGFETVSIIKGTCRHTPVIFHSTYGLPQSPCHCAVDGVVLKSHNLDHLKKVVQGLLSSRRSQDTCGKRRGRSLAQRRREGHNGINGN